jgi:hypothetical protein
MAGSSALQSCRAGAQVLWCREVGEILIELAEDAGIADPEGLAHNWHLLMKGSIVAASEGDRCATRRAREVAALVLADAPRR